MYTKLYDIHFEIGIEQGMYYARNVLGNNAIEFKQYAGNVGDAVIMCVSDMNANGAFQSLNRDPSLSVYPFVPPLNYMITTHGVGGHHHSHQPATPAIQTCFDLHFECGIESGTGMHKVKTTLVTAPPNGLLSYRDEQKFLDDALCEVVRKLDDAALFDQLLQNPLMSVYPLPSGSGSTSISPSSVCSTSATSKKKEDVVRKRPSDIGHDAVFPACQDICMSYDHFRDQKCRSICEWRF